MKCRVRGWLVVVACAGWACGRSAPDPEILAKVGEAAIRGSELLAYEASMKIGERRGRDLLADRAGHLQTLIDRQLLLQDARARGLYDDPVVRQRLARRETKHLAEEALKSAVLAKLSVSVAEVEREYEQGGWKEQVVALEMFTPSRQRAIAALSLLNGGTAFEEVARQYSVDRLMGLPANGPTRSTYSPGDSPREVVAAVLDLPVGAITDTIAWRDGYVVAKVWERRPVSLREVARKISKSLTRTKRQALREAYLIHLRETYRLTFDQSGMDCVVDVLAGRVGVDSLSVPERQAPVYTYDGGSLSVTDVLEELARDGERRRDRGGPAVAGYLKEHVLPDRLMALEARQGGRDQTEAYRRWREGQLAGLVLTRLHGVVAESGSEIAGEDLEAHYQEHKQRFRIPPSVTVLDILVPTPEEARSLKRRILAGEDMGDLARRHSLRKRATDGRLTAYANQEFLFGSDWLAAALNAPLGELRGPLETRGGYSLFKALEREPESHYPLQGRVERIVRREVREEREQIAFNEYLYGLREERADQIEVYEQNLEAQPVVRDTTAADAGAASDG